MCDADLVKVEHGFEKQPTTPLMVVNVELRILFSMRPTILRGELDTLLLMMNFLQQPLPTYYICQLVYASNICCDL